MRLSRLGAGNSRDVTACHVTVTLVTRDVTGNVTPVTGNAGQISPAAIWLNVR